MVIRFHVSLSISGMTNTWHQVNFNYPPYFYARRLFLCIHYQNPVREALIRSNGCSDCQKLWKLCTIWTFMKAVQSASFRNSTTLWSFLPLIEKSFWETKLQTEYKYKKMKQMFCLLHFLYLFMGYCWITSSKQPLLLTWFYISLFESFTFALTI